MVRFGCIYCVRRCWVALQLHFHRAGARPNAGTSHINMHKSPHALCTSHSGLQQMCSYQSCKMCRESTAHGISQMWQLACRL